MAAEVRGGADAGRASRQATGPTTGPLAVVVAALIWGTTGTATHFAPGVPAVVFGGVTFGLGGLVLAALSWPATRLVLRTRDVRRPLVLAVVTLLVYAVTFYAGLAWAGIALGTTIAIGTSPVSAGLIGWWADGRPVSGSWVLATVVSVVGMALVTLARAGGAGGAVPASRLLLVAGVLCGLVAGLTYALYSRAVAAMLSRDRVLRDAPVAALPARGVVGAVFGLGALPLVVLVLVVGRGDLGVAANWPVFLYLALVPTVLGHTLYALGLRSVTAAVGTLLSLLEPVVAAVLAVIVVGEHLGVLGWAGVTLVVVGLGVLGVRRR